MVMSKAEIRAALDRAQALGADIADACKTVAQAMCLPVEATEQVAYEVAAGC